MYRKRPFFSYPFLEGTRPFLPPFSPLALHLPLSLSVPLSLSASAPFLVAEKVVVYSPRGERSVKAIRRSLFCVSDETCPGAV